MPNVDEPGAIGMFVPGNLIFPGYWGYKPKWLVVHKTGGPGDAQQQAQFFASTGNVDEVSSHYVVGQDGTIVQCVSEADGAGGNGRIESGCAPFLPTNINLNLLTISVEHCDPALDNSTPVTSAQKAASFRLIHDICQRHDIPMRPGDTSGGIIGHYQIDPIDRSHCPGNYPWQELFAYLQQGSEETPMLQLSDLMGKFFTANAVGDRWHCTKTNQDIAYALLTFYRSYGGVFGLPVSGEIYLQAYPNTAIQYCERAILVYDPKHIIDNQPGAGDCYLLHVDSGIGQRAVAKPLLDALQTQVNTLTAQVHDLTSEIATLRAQPEPNTLELEAQIAAMEKQVAVYKQIIASTETAFAALPK